VGPDTEQDAKKVIYWVEDGVVVHPSAHSTPPNMVMDQLSFYV
jgi:hypothetical protein